MDEDGIPVEVCYARADRQIVKHLRVPSGTTLEQAIHASGILGEAPEIDLGAWRAGIYGKLKPADTVLRENDRVEIYRPLVADPKEARRRRAQKKDEAESR